MSSSKALILAFVIVITIIITGGYFLYTAQINSIIDDSYNDLAAIKNLKVKQITDWRNERMGDAHAIFANALVANELKKYLRQKDKKTKENLTEWFNTLKHAYKYKEILLVDRNFEPIISSENASLYTKEHIRNFMNKKGENGIYISQIHKNKLSQLHYSIKIDLFEKSERVGSLIVIMDPSNFLYPLVKEWPTPSKTAETLLVREEGDSLVFLNELRHGKSTALEFKLPLSDTTLPAAAAIKGHSGMFRGYDYRGVKVLSDIGPVPGTDWFIISKIDEDEIFSKPIKYLIFSIVIIVLLILLSYILFVYLWKTIKTKSLKNELELKKEKLRMSNLYATLSQINQAIVREQSRSELLLRITKLPIEFGDFEACSLSLKSERTKIAIVESFYGSISYFDKILLDDSTYKISDPGSESILEEKTIVHNKLTVLSEEWMHIALEHNIRSCAASPIIIGNKTVGSIALYSRDENSFEESEIRLIEEIASDIAFSLETINKNEKRKAIEKQVIESERRLAALFSNLPGIAYRCAFNKDWTMEFMSEGTLNVTGYTPKEIVENKIVNYGDLILPEFRDYVWKEVNEAVNRKSSFTIIYKISTITKDERWVWERGIPIFDSEGEVVFIEGFINDITELKEAQNKSHRSEEYFRYIFHNNPLSMWIYDLSTYKFLDVNAAATEQYGYSREDFLNMTLFDIRPQEEFYKLKDYLETRKTETSGRTEATHKLKNGSLINVLIISHKIEYEERFAVLVAAIDVTDSKEAEKQLVEAKEKAEANERIKTDFLAQMSHEIRTPVNVILSFSSLIKDSLYSSVDDDLKEGFNSISYAGNRLIRTIDSILNMAQINSGSFDFNPAKLSLYEDILLPLEHEFHTLSSLNNLQFKVINKCKNAIVYGDQYSLSQIFANLIDNALKYTKEGSVTVTIKCDPDSVSVSVKDTGIGISEEFLPKLFTAFSQEETGYSRRYEGTGLGLALVSNYCKLNKAEITVKSQKHKGTTFTVTLPK